jgi:hypothetical protein
MPGLMHEWRANRAWNYSVHNWIDADNAMRAIRKDERPGPNAAERK